jgi:hypothetical protein
MIDTTKEQVLSLHDACGVIPPGRGAKKTVFSTIFRWVLKGTHARTIDTEGKAHKGQLVKLEAIRVGGRWVTSREALQRFFEALTEVAGGSERPVPRTATRIRRASERASRELEAAGI